MKKIKIKIILYSVLTVFVSGFLFLLILAITLSPIVRKYTVTNNTNETVYITPLMQYGVNELEEERDDAVEMKEYIKRVDNFSILSQYLFYSAPALPTFKNKDIKVNPNSKVILYIDYDALRQEEGPQILLIKDKLNNYSYLEANFWDSDIIRNNNLLQVAPKNLIESIEGGYEFSYWFFLIGLAVLILLFPYLLVKNIKLFRIEKKAILKHTV